MQIAERTVASFHYTLTNDAGTVIDSSSGADPLTYLHGVGHIVPGLEQAMAGHQAGDKFEVKVSPEEGYGTPNEMLIQVVPREAFQGVDDIQVGMQFQPAQHFHVQGLDRAAQRLVGRHRQHEAQRGRGIHARVQHHRRLRQLAQSLAQRLPGLLRASRGVRRMRARRVVLRVTEVQRRQRRHGSRDTDRARHLDIGQERLHVGARGLQLGP